MSAATQPKISVVVPLYNGAKYIEQALQSILCQTTAPTEIVIIDDGSTDDGGAIVERLSSLHPTIKLLRKENGGQSSARNFGVAHSDGDLIALLDQDDVWYQDHLEKLVKPFSEARFRKLGWVYSNLDEIDEQGLMVTHSFCNTGKTLGSGRI